MPAWSSQLASFWAVKSIRNSRAVGTTNASGCISVRHCIGTLAAVLAVPCHRQIQLGSELVVPHCLWVVSPWGRSGQAFVAANGVSAKVHLSATSATNSRAIESVCRFKELFTDHHNGHLQVATKTCENCRSSYYIKFIHSCQPWINKPLGCLIGGVPFKYWIMTIGGVPPN